MHPLGRGLVTYQSSHHGSSASPNSVLSARKRGWSVGSVHQSELAPATRKAPPTGTRNSFPTGVGIALRPAGLIRAFCPGGALSTQIGSWEAPRDLGSSGATRVRNERR